MGKAPLRFAVLLVCLLLTACTAATPDELLARARAAIEENQYNVAEIHLKNLLQQERGNAAARRLLGEVLLETGDLAGAEQSLRMALDAGADTDTSAELPLLNALVAQRKFQEALELAESRGLPRDPADATQVAILQGTAYRGLSQPERAIEVYRAALEANPGAADLRTELAGTLFGVGGATEARQLLEAVLSSEPNYSPALLLQGSVETATGRSAAAETTLQKVVDIERPNAARSQRYSLAMAQLIEAQIALGKTDAAAENAAAFLALNGRNPLARYAVASVELAQNDLAAAEARLEQLVAEAPEYWPAYRMLGVINMRQDQLGQATTYLRTAVNNNPTDSTARLQLAELYIRQGDLDAARALMEASLGGGSSDELFLAFAAGASQRAGLQDQADELFSRSEQQAPTNLRELIGVSNLYAAAGEFERAIRVLQSSSLDDEQSQQVSQYLLALVYVRQGNLDSADEIAESFQGRQAQAAWPLNLRTSIALLRRDYAGARAFATRALALEPRNVSAILNLSRIAAAENDNAGAERHLRDALEADPTQPIALIALAQIEMSRGELATAQSLLDRAPESTMRMRAQADLFALQGRLDDAAQLQAQVFALEPSEATALRAFAVARRAGRANADEQLRRWHADHPADAATNHTLATLALEQNDLPEAQRLYEAVLAVKPDPATMNNLAWIYGQRGDPRAVELGERALAAQPDNPAIADTLGWLYLQNGDAARGLPLLTTAAAALPGDPDVNYHWAVALAETGDAARAIDILQRLTADNRQFTNRTDAERRLSELRRAR